MSFSEKEVYTYTAKAGLIICSLYNKQKHYGNNIFSDTNSF